MYYLGADVFLLLIELLGQQGIRVPHLLHNYSTRMILACISSLVIWLWLGPRFIKKLYEWRIGQKIRMEECPMLGQLHEKKKETPTMGGVLILSAMSVSAFLWMDWTHLYTWVLVVGSVILGLIGSYDDFLKLKWKNPKGLSARKKLVGQLAIGLIISGFILSDLPASYVPLKYPKGYELSSVATHRNTGQHFKDAPPIGSISHAISTSHIQHLIYVPGVKKPFELPQTWWAKCFLACFICFIICGSSNAVNLTDGLDGLAAGGLIQSALCLALAAFISNHVHFSNYLNWLYIEGSGEVAIFLMALVGACVGFLWFNCHPAQVFMGDTGSLGLGGALGIAAVLLRRELFFGIASGLFIIETLSVIIQVWSFKRRQARVFLCAPLHHHFEYKGWAETKVVTRFWIIGLLFGMLALITIKLQ